MSIAPSASAAARLTLLTLLSAATVYCFYKSRRLKLASKNPNVVISPSRGKLFYISETGTSNTLANYLLKLLQSNGLLFDLIDVKDYEPEDLSKETLVLIVASTWEDGKAPESARFFVNWIEESVEDFMVGALLLKKCRYAVFGVGSRSYGEERFNCVAKDLCKWMRGLSGDEMLDVYEGDVDEGDLYEVFDRWSGEVVARLKGGMLGNGERELVVECGSDEEEFDDGSDEEEEEDDEVGYDDGIVDLEDLAGRGPIRKSGQEVSSVGSGKVNGEKEMVTPIIRATLEKQVNIFPSLNSGILCTLIVVHFECVYCGEVDNFSGSR